MINISKNNFYYLHNTQYFIFLTDKIIQLLEFYIKYVKTFSKQKNRIFFGFQKNQKIFKKTVFFIYQYMEL